MTENSEETITINSKETINSNKTINKETINIVVLCDGTLNNPLVETNVYRLHMILLSHYATETETTRGLDIHVHDKLKQFRSWFKNINDHNRKKRKIREIPNDAFCYKDQHYQAGVGGMFKITDTVVACNIDEKIKSAYRHIVRRYNDNENKNKKKEIWLFGFSRGAHTVRYVAGMIQNCGILRFDSKELINRAYELYRNNSKKQESELFRNSFSHPLESTKIKFLGLWDTVSAHGLPSLTIGKGFEYHELHDNDLSNVRNAYQALSIHEKSVFFEPISISRKGKENKTCEKCKKNEECKKNVECECFKLEEIWFPGDHLEVGGGIYSVDHKIPDESLQWMIKKILCTGGLLSVDRVKEEEEIIKLTEEFLTIKIPKSIFRSLKQNVLPIVPVYGIKRTTAFFSLMCRHRTIPLYRDDNDMLTFDLLYEEGHWENTKKRFPNIDKIKEHKHKKPDSLTKFYDAMEDILIEELKGTSRRGASDAKDVNGTKAKYREQNIKKIKEIYNEIEMDKKNSDDKMDKKNSDDEIDEKDKEKIRRLFKEIDEDRIDNIESFDAKTISKFNIERLIHQYKVRMGKDFCQKCNSNNLVKSGDT
ncbi:hypothetical protein Glove_219g18 [Diversispora epigaea]|uniref:T6SS Phospholipase effector Tle1-like catalytic domain-containing protein n=1 Tax=Diversispora epigaea TaxID=1348612 RepID=A0A397IFX4_9GLOM|nr:hypothetical protein Glove_219g18 [Diversispora epigaea]